MTTSITRSSHTMSLIDGEIVEENDLGLHAARHRRQPAHPQGPSPSSSSSSATSAPRTSASARPWAPSVTPRWATPTICPPPTSPRSAATRATTSWRPASATSSLPALTSTTPPRVRHRSPGAGAELRQRERALRPRPVLADPQGPVDVYVAGQREPACANRSGTRSPPTPARFWRPSVRGRSGRRARRWRARGGSPVSPRRGCALWVAASTTGAA